MKFFGKDNTFSVIFFKKGETFLSCLLKRDVRRIGNVFKCSVGIGVLILLMLFSAVSIARTFTSFAPGLDYNRYISESKQITHVLIIDPKQVILKSVHANNTVQGLETVASLARQEKALAAINGGFFRMGENVDGLPSGILKIADRWFGIAYGSHGALGWSIAKNEPVGNESSVLDVNDQGDRPANHQSMPVLMDRLQTKTSIEFNAVKFPVHGVNQPGHPKKAILYNDAYGASTDRIEGGIDVIIQNDQVQAVLPAGDHVVPAAGFIYTLGPQAKRPYLSLTAGSSAKINIKVNPALKKHEAEAWQNIENIVGGIPLLIDDGKILQENERMLSSFAHQQHARTAVGILPSGQWVIVVVEKSRVSRSPGMTLPELSRFLEQLGCRMALNLDGGGSSTLYLDGKVINHPENELDENIVLPIARPVGDAILVLPKDRS